MRLDLSTKAGIPTLLLVTATLTSGACGLASGDGDTAADGLLTSAEWQRLSDGDQVFEAKLPVGTFTHPESFSVGPARCRASLETECGGFLGLSCGISGEIVCESDYTLTDPPLSNFPSLTLRETSKLKRQSTRRVFEATVPLGHDESGTLRLRFEGKTVVRVTYAGPTIVREDLPRPPETAQQDVTAPSDPFQEIEQPNTAEPPWNCLTPDDSDMDMCYSDQDCVYTWDGSKKVYRGRCLPHDVGCNRDATGAFRTVRFGGVLMRQFCDQKRERWTGSRDDQESFELIPCEILDTRYFGLTSEQVNGPCKQP